MKLTFRVGILVLVIAVFVAGLTSTVTVRADNNTCYGLSADDCTLAQAARGPYNGKLSAFTMDYQVSMTTTGMPRNVDFSVKGSGPFEFDRTGSGLAGLSITKAATALRSIDLLTMADTLSATATINGNVQNANFEFRILNGTLYFMGDKATQGKWMSVDLKQLVALAGRARRGNFVIGDLNRFTANPAMSLQLFALFTQLSNTPGFITAKRAADTTDQGQQIANFVYNIDLPIFFKSPAFIGLLKTTALMTPNMPRMSPDQLNNLPDLLATAFKGSTISVTDMIGVTDKLPHGLGFDVVINLDAASVQSLTSLRMSANSTPVATQAATAPADVSPAATAAATGEATPQAISLNFHFLVKLTNIGGKADVTAPAGAQAVNLNKFAEVATPAATMSATLAATAAQ